MHNEPMPEETKLKLQITCLLIMVGPFMYFLYAVVRLAIQ